VIQLILNAAWTPIFFAAGNYGLAVIDIILLWLAIAVTVVWFGRVHRVAAGLLIPYWLWVTYASALTIAIWWANR
jgi:tryptophan-rich sensory protein